MAVLVQLPNDELIECSSFCRRIARAVRPAAEDGPEGIDCVVAKLVSVENRAVVSPGRKPWAIDMQEQLVLTSHDGKTLRQLLPDSSDGGIPTSLDLALEDPPKIIVNEFFLPFRLNEQERAELGDLLTHLPPLRYPMSDEALEDFREAYIALSVRPDWEPLLLTPAQVACWQAEQDAIFDHHQKALQDDLSLGLLSAFDDRHVRVSNLVFGIRISRVQAIEYLNRHGISHCDVAPPNRLGNEQRSAEAADLGLQISTESVGSQRPVSMPELAEEEPMLATQGDSPPAAQSELITSENKKRLRASYP